MVAFLQAAEMGRCERSGSTVIGHWLTQRTDFIGIAVPDRLSGTLDMDVGGVLHVCKVIGMYTA